MPEEPLKYNPGMLGDAELVRRFVVRHNYLQLLIEALRENASSDSAARHVLIVGPRGIGKTMLVRRLAAEVKQNPEYSGTWLPIVFGEESYGVTSPGEFWLEALTHLSASAGGPKLDATLRELREEANDARLRERALQQLLDPLVAQGKRLLLVVENLNMLCEQIPASGLWELRHTLLNEPRIMLLGTATSRFSAIDHANEAWFDLFSLHEIKPLDAEEGSVLWQSIADQELKPRHARAIRILTGGSPRLLTLLARFAIERSFGELMDQLTHLIDDHTDYFKSHLDSLPTKERKVFVAVLEAWDPIGTAEVATAARMSVNESSSLLKRLESRGAVELFDSKPRRKVYQATERLYNIYYLMRRRGLPSDRVRAVVSFIAVFYKGRALANTLAQIAEEACVKPPGSREEHYSAYLQLLRALPLKLIRDALLHSPAPFFSHADTPEPLRAFAGPVAARRLLDQAVTLREREGINAASSEWLQLEKACRDALTRSSPSAALWMVLGVVLQAQDRDEEAVNAYRAAVEGSPRQAIGWEVLGAALARTAKWEEAVAAFRRATELAPANPRYWKVLGTALAHQADHESAAEAFLKALDLDPDDQDTWPSAIKALLTTSRETEAERISLEALDRHPSAWKCRLALIDLRQRRSVPWRDLSADAERCIEDGKRSNAVLLPLALMALRSRTQTGWQQGEEWAREAVENGAPPEAHLLLALAYAERGKETGFLVALRQWLDVEPSAPELNEVTAEILVQAAAQGLAAQVQQVITESRRAGAWEPLLTGIQLYLGQSPRVAKELLEVGGDVAEKIRHIAAERRERGEAKVT